MQKSKLQSMGGWGETEGAPGENERGVGPAPAGLCVAVVDSWSCAGGLPSVAGDGPCACGLCGCQGEGKPQRRPLQPYQRWREATRREARPECDKSRLCFLRPICAPASGPPAVFHALPRFFPARDSFPLPARVPRASLLASRAFSTA